MVAMFKYVAWLLLLSLPWAAALAGPGALGPAHGRAHGIAQPVAQRMDQRMNQRMDQGMDQDMDAGVEQGPGMGQGMGQGMGSTGAAIASTGLATHGTLASPGAAAPLPQVERVLVRKSERRMYLMRGEEILRSYRISLGLRPEGSKERAGDYRTPEGSYRLARRNPNSDYFLSIQVSYPGPQDLERARRNHWNPGGSVMVHGQPNSPRHPAGFYAREDWTDGCIALTNADMTEFWLLTHDNMPIDIEP